MPEQESLRTPTSEAVTNNVRVEVESQYSRRALAAVSEPLVLSLHGPHHQRRRRDRAAPQPSLDHHRRQRPDRGGQRSWRRRRTAGALAGRVVRVHLGVSAEDFSRRDARHLSDGQRRRRAHFDVEIAPFALQGTATRFTERFAITLPRTPTAPGESRRHFLSQVAPERSNRVEKRVAEIAAFFAPTP